MSILKAAIEGFKEGWDMAVSEKDKKEMKTMANKISDNVGLGVHFDVNKTKDKKQKSSINDALKPAGEDDGFSFRF